MSRDGPSPHVSPEIDDSPRWDRNIKFLVGILSLIVLAAVALQFSDLILRVVAAAIIAYVMTPVINMVSQRTPLSRGAAIIVAYFLLLVLLFGGGVVLGLSTINQVVDLIESVPNLVEQIIEWMSTTEIIHIGPVEVRIAALWGAIDWEEVQKELLSTLIPVVNQGGRTILSVVNSTVRVVTNVAFTFIISVYLAFEVGKFGGYISGAIYQPGYRKDTERILRRFGRIWRAYLRGQIILGLIIGLAVWAILSLIGVKNAFGLGVLSGMLEFLPAIGPFIGTVVAAAVGFFQPTNYLSLSPVTYALVIIGVMLVIQQIENNILVPRIVGGSLDLHPLVIIIGVFMGAALAGLIGAILAAPLMATFKLVGSYAWRKMFDLPPFPESEEEEPPGQ